MSFIDIILNYIVVPIIVVVWGILKIFGSFIKAVFEFVYHKFVVLVGGVVFLVVLAWLVNIFHVAKF